MITETLSALTESPKGVLAPVQKLHKQAASALAQLSTHQLESLRTYSELGINQVKAAAQVRDAEGLRKLLSKQAGVMGKARDRLLSDFRAVFQVGADFVSQTAKAETKSAKAA